MLPGSYSILRATHGRSVTATPGGKHEAQNVRGDPRLNTSRFGGSPAVDASALQGLKRLRPSPAGGAAHELVHGQLHRHARDEPPENWR